MYKNIINKYCKIILFLFCVLFIFDILTSTIISSDAIHTSLCQDDDCIICQIIHNANNFSKSINYLIKYIVLFNVIIPLVYIIKSKKRDCFKETLIDRNVILLE